MEEKDFEVGDYLYASWGYDQTNIDFAKIVEVSSTGKTVVCRMCKQETVRSEKTSDYVVPTEPYGDKFRLHVRNGSYGVYFRGSYPYCQGDFSNGKRMGTFSLWNGKPKYQTALGFGH